MEHIAAFMLLISCSQDLQACSEQPAPAVAYETLQQCEMELKPAVASATRTSRTTFGQCIEIDPAMFYEDAELIWDVTPTRGLEVAIEIINPQINIDQVAQSSQTGNQASQFN